MDVRQIVTGNASRSRARRRSGEEQRAEPCRLPSASSTSRALAWIATDASAESQLDPVLAVELGRAQRYPFLGRIAGEVILRQIGPVAGRRIIIAQHRDRAGITLLP